MISEPCPLMVTAVHTTGGNTPSLVIFIKIMGFLNVHRAPLALSKELILWPDTTARSPPLSFGRAIPRSLIKLKCGENPSSVYFFLDKAQSLSCSVFHSPFNQAVPGTPRELPADTAALGKGRSSRNFAGGIREEQSENQEMASRVCSPLIPLENQTWG